MSNKPKPERIVLQANKHELICTLTSLTENQRVEFGSNTIIFLDTVIHADGRGHKVDCYDAERDPEHHNEPVTLNDFPIQILKLIEVARYSFKDKDHGSGNVRIGFKNGAFASLYIQRPGQDEIEIDLKKLPDH